MSATAPVPARSSTAPATTSAKPQVIWQARIWAFLSDDQLRAIPCVSSNFQFCLPILKMKTAMDRALYHQRLAYQALKLAKMALDWDFSFQGASGLSHKFLTLGPRQSPGIEIVGEGGSIEAIHPPSPTTQSRELSRGSKCQEFTGKTTSANQSPTEFHNKDPLSKAIESNSTTCDLIEDAIISIKANHMKDRADVNRPTASSSSIPNVTQNLAARMRESSRELEILTDLRSTIPKALTRPGGQVLNHVGDSVELLEEEPTLAEEAEESASTPEDAMAIAFDHQTRSCQFQELATEAIEEMTRINLYVDFRVQGASKSQPLPSILTAQRAEPIFLSPYQIDENYYAQPNKEDDPIDEALKSSCTAYKFIELATDWIHGETQEAEGDEGDIDDSSTQKLQAGQTPADQPYCSEEDDDDVDEGAGNLKPNPNRTALNLSTYSVEPKTPDLHFHLQPPETPDSVARCLQFTPDSQGTSTPVPVYPEPSERSPYPLWNPQPPSDPRWRAVIMESQESSPIPHEPLTPPVKFTLSSPSAQEPNPEDETF